MSGFSPHVLTDDILGQTFRWVICSAAIVITCGRFYIRRRHKATRLDDVFNGAAIMSLIAFILILNQSETPSAYLDIIYFKYQLAASMLGWSTLYSVKASFLALSWSIFNISAKFRRAWWIVSVYTLLTFLVVTISQLWQCGSPSHYADNQLCSYSSDFATKITITATTLHISSDCMILVLPFAMIKKSSLSKAKKVSVSAVFMLIVIDITMGIVRNVAWIIILQNDPEPLYEPYLNSQEWSNVSFLVDIMSICEPSIAVIVCAMPAYWVILPSVREETNQRQWPQPRPESPHLYPPPRELKHVPWVHSRPRRPARRASAVLQTSTPSPISTFAIETREDGGADQRAASTTELEREF